MKALAKHLITLLLLQASVAGAESVYNQKLKQFTSDLIANGVTQVGELNLQTFHSELDKIQWYITAQSFSKPAIDALGVTISVGQGGGLVTSQGVHIPERLRPHRESARYITNQVFLGAGLANQEDSTSRTQMLLHEALGALGYNDNHSAQSSSLMLIHKHPGLAAPLGDAFFNTRSLAAGGSSVGGGGDFDSIDLKQKVLQEIFYTSTSITPNFLSNYAGITFEPMDEPQNQRIMVMYEFNRKGLWGKQRFSGVRQDRNYEELVTVLFPRQAFLNGSTKTKSLIIQLISFGVLSIFPSSGDQVNEFSYDRACDGTPLFLPRELSSGANLVWHFRANMIANCWPRKGQNYNEVGFEVNMPRDRLR